MFTYEVVRVEIKTSLWKTKPETTSDYREIINSYAEKGWRFKQIFAPSISGYGTATYFDLIFEKEIS